VKEHAGISRNFAVMRFYFALLFLLLVGCASDKFSVTMFRTGGVSGISERYSINQDNRGVRSISLGDDSDAKRSNYTIDGQLTSRVHALVVDSLASLSAIKMRDTGELTTGLQIDARNVHMEISWANIDPPDSATPLLDSLYRTMLLVEAKMIPPR
jgi:hypothetical protein